MTVNRFTFTVAVPVPTGLTATAASSSQINLSWAAVSVATGYRVYRNGSLVGSPTAASYSDTGLSASTTYTYRVTALIGTAESAQSSQASATTQSSGGGSPGAAVLTWSVPTTDVYGAPLTDLAGFKVYKGTSQYWLTLHATIANPNATGTTVSGLAAGTWYFSVRAYTTDGQESEFSDLVSRVVT